jgi:hypothetical protein
MAQMNLYTSSAVSLASTLASPCRAEKKTRGLCSQGRLLAGGFLEDLRTGI